MMKFKHTLLADILAVACGSGMAQTQNSGKRVDFALPWDVPHSGDYDLDELFDWIDKTVRQPRG